MLLPHLYLSSVTRLNAENLRARGIHGLLLDIDGTLKDFAAESFPPAVVAWLDDLRAAGIGLCLFSNGRARRIRRLAQQIQLPFVAEALKPLPAGCRRGLEILGLAAAETAVVGDQIFADVVAGRLAGLQTVLVQPTSRAEPWFTRLKRPFEVPLRWLLRGRLDAGVAPPESVAVTASADSAPARQSAAASA